jgi:hypothetical protein
MSPPGVTDFSQSGISLFGGIHTGEMEIDDMGVTAAGLLGHQAKR